LAFAAWPVLADFSPPKHLTVVSDDAYPPYLFRGENGRLQGILVDKWSLWSRRNGVQVTVEGTEWARAQKSVLAGDADVIEAINYNEARAPLYEFSRSWGAYETRIFFHHSISGIKDVADMRGFAVATKEGSSCTRWLQDRGVQVLRTYPDFAAMVQAATAGQIRLFCMDLQAAQYYFYKQQIAGEFRQTAPLYEGKYYWAVAKSRPELRDFIQRGFERISAAELEEIDGRWLGNPLRLPIDPRYFYALAGVLATILAAAGLLALLNRTLRASVAERTAELDGRNRILELIAAGAPLEASMDALLRLVEQGSAGVASAVGLLDDDGTHVRICAGPSLPRSFVREMDPQPVGEKAGCCGTAVYRREAVIVEDIATDPLWSERRDVALKHGFRACWSTPIFDDQKRVLGTFALFYRAPHRPGRADLRLIETATHVAAIAISRKRTEEQLRRSYLQQRDMARRLVEAEETERRNVNRELHDRVGQNLSALQLNLATVQVELGQQAPAPVSARLEEALVLLETTSNQVRDVMSELRPAALDDFGLLAALREHAKAAAERLGITIDVAGPDAEPRLPAAAETAMFRIAQEALNNVGKHARARHVKVTLGAIAQGVRLVVADDGVGFDAGRPPRRTGHYGIATMRERAEAVGARLRIVSAPDSGTRIEVDLATDTLAQAAE
jgi:signal transduction histidine kinase/ABC-type amino acid transport substrate-binding protein